MEAQLAAGRDFAKLKSVDSFEERIQFISGQTFLFTDADFAVLDHANGDNDGLLIIQAIKALAEFFGDARVSLNINVLSNHVLVVNFDADTVTTEVDEDEEVEYEEEIIYDEDDVYEDDDDDDDDGAYDDDLDEDLADELVNADQAVAEVMPVTDDSTEEMAHDQAGHEEVAAEIINDDVTQDDVMLDNSAPHETAVRDDAHADNDAPHDENAYTEQPPQENYPANSGYQDSYGEGNRY